MTPILILLAAAAAAPQTPQEQLRGCTQLARTAPDKAVAAAEDWRLKGGGIEARHCLGLAYSAGEKWAAAGTAFENAAREAETRKDVRSGDLWTNAGNAWLAAEDAAKARKAFDAALAGAALPAELRGEVHLDRGRAAIALGDIAAARSDVDKGLELVPADPFGWYLSAALARRENKLARAQADIAKAVSLAPNEAAILLEAGNIAGSSGEAEAALAFYERALRAAPQSEAGRAAQAALAANRAPEPATLAAPAQPQAR